MVYLIPVGRDGLNPEFIHGAPVERVVIWFLAQHVEWRPVKSSEQTASYLCPCMRLFSELDLCLDSSN